MNIIHPEDHTGYVRAMKYTENDTGDRGSLRSRSRKPGHGGWFWMSSGASIRGTRDPQEIREFIRRAVGSDQEQRSG